MSRPINLLALCGVLAFAVAVGAAPALKSRPTPDPLLGRWAATDMYINEKPDPQWQGLEYAFAPGGRWVIYRDGKEFSGERSFSADAKAPAIDLTENGNTYLGFYQVEPNERMLTISYTTGGGGPRPYGVEPRVGTLTIILKRVKAD